MKTIGNLLLVISLIGAMLSAATAYLAKPSLPDEAFQKTVDGETEYAQLATPAGEKALTEAQREELRAKYVAGEISAESYTNQLHSRAPLVKATPTAADIASSPEDVDTDPNQIRYAGDDESGTRLTPERLAAIRAASETGGGESNGATGARGAIHVKTFSFDRWPYWWVFAISAIGLFTGSMLVRAGTKAEIAAATAAASPTGDKPAASPEASLQSIIDIVAVLRRELPGLPSDKLRNELILERLDIAQKIHIAAFIDARPLLVNRFGLGGYAELMDRFAASERQINRAWSAAADGVYHESAKSLETASALLEETKPKLGMA